MKHMKKEKRNPRSHELIREMIELYHPQSIKDIQEMLKDMFADTMEDMLKAELDTELGYSKNSQAAKTTENRRNGSYPKTVTSSMGEIELNIPRDRMGEYDPELIPKGTKDVSALEEKVLSLYAKGVNKHSDTKEIDVVDFKQRFTTIAAFANDEFKLSKNLKPLTIDGTEYEIAGKKFSKLDEAVQSRFNDRDISIITMTDATEEEIVDIFERINMGHQLSNGQKRSTIESNEVREIIYSIADHPFFEKVLSPAQFKKNLDRDIVIQCLMLTEKTDKNNFTSFRDVDMNKFIMYYNDKIADPNEKQFAEKKIENLRKALDKLNEELPEDVKIKASTIPMCIYGMYRMVRDSKSTSKYMEWLNKFLASYDTNLDYLQYCSNGTSNSDMVNGRLQFFKDAIKEIG